MTITGQPVEMPVGIMPEPEGTHLSPVVFGPPLSAKTPLASGMDHAIRVRTIVERLDTAPFGNLLDYIGLHDLPADELAVIEHHNRITGEVEGRCIQPATGNQCGVLVQKHVCG